MIQPSSFHSAASVVGGSVLPSNSWPALPIGNGCQSMARPAREAAAFITLTASGTTSRPMSSPSRIPIFKAGVSPETLPGGIWSKNDARQVRVARILRDRRLAPQWPLTQRRTDSTAPAADLTRHKSTVHRQRLSGDRRRARTRQKNDGGGDFLGRDEAPGRDAREHARARRVVVPRRARRRERRARRDGVDPDILRDPFDREHPD